MLLKYKTHLDDYHGNVEVHGVQSQEGAWSYIKDEVRNGYDVSNIELTGCGPIPRGRCLFCNDHAIATVPVENIVRGDVCINCALKHDHPDTRLGFDITRNSGRWTGD